MFDKPIEVGPNEFPMYEKELALPEGKTLADTTGDIPQGPGSRLDSDSVDGINAYVDPSPNALVPLNTDAQLPIPTVPYYYAVWVSPSTTAATYTINLSSGAVSGGTLTYLTGSDFPDDSTVIYLCAQRTHDEPGAHAAASNPYVTGDLAQGFTATSVFTASVGNNSGVYAATGNILFIGIRTQ